MVEEWEMIMEFIDLPEHLNFSHSGLHSPVIFRLEGGNPIGGFCIEEYRSRVPHVKLYGDLAEVRHMFTGVVKVLPTFLALMIEGNLADHSRSPHQGWFNFEYRSPMYRLGLYCGSHGVTGDCTGLHPSHRMSISNTDLRANMISVQARIEAIYRRYYNV